MKSAPLFPIGRSILLGVLLVAVMVPAAWAAGYLGVHVQNVDETLAAALDLEEADGVLVSEVVEDSPAEAAGLQRGDLILTIDGNDASDVERFTRRVRRIDAGEKTTLEILRKGKTMKLEATLEEAPEREFFGRAPRRMHAPDADLRWFDDGDADMFFSRSGAQLGVNVHGLDEDLGHYFGADEGVLVLGVIEESAAEEAGLKAGDVITAIDDEAVESTIGLHEFLADHDPGDKVAVRILRDRKEQTVDVELGESDGVFALRGTRRGGPGRHGIHVERAPMPPEPMRVRIHHDEDLQEEIDMLRERLERLEQQLEGERGN